MFACTQFIIFTITSLIVFIFSNYLNLLYFFDIYKQWFFNDIKDFQLYDFIIVGAGTAGAILTTKLTEYGYTILLLEAGGTAPPFLDIPLLAPLIQNTPYDWKYITVPQQHACKGLKNNQSKWPMGKILGGTSRLNYMLYVRGHPLDYNDWFPDFTEPIKKNGGPIPVSDSEWNTGLADIILKGLQELHQDIGNINDNLKNGFMKVQLSMENGKRWSTDKLLHENLKNKLTIITHAYVENVLMQSNRAVGVQFVALNKTFKAMAEKGVILCAGAIGSPKILMLSGIGPKKHLEDLNINVINDLPVGQHLIDHVLTGIDLIVLNTSISLRMSNTLNPMSALNYFFFGKGPWTFTGVEVLGTFHSSIQKNKSSIPDLQIMVMPLGVTRDNGIVLKEAMGISDEVYNEYFAPNLYKNTITIAPVLLHPKSKGEIKLSSSNSFDPLLIDPKYLSNKDDIAVLVDGLQFVKKLVGTNAMKSVGATIHEKHFPGCENEIFDSTKYWECYIQHLTLTSYHPAGTCRMGDVVDQTFKIYGTTNLYVIDASVLPTLPSGNINAAVIMIAEKAARIIKQDVKVNINHTKCHKSYSYCYTSND
ncbi:PREDICTED: glucose dehydrogenase [FAD, quinone]-like [Eufriesea mexicana]|uniref:glucose dehydrogenase [FAD, quinone]-like n=1 Tax=Eufriesea mexicana TaxID=516756 RepID=UPI00083BB32F|nr:PREDICTED: glucose dehydrogenase [FAD, quinone]-like [Eufriesea mexicana]